MCMYVDTSACVFLDFVSNDSIITMCEYVCMYVCMYLHVCMYICMYVYVCPLLCLLAFFKISYENLTPSYSLPLP